MFRATIRVVACAVAPLVLVPAAMAQVSLTGQINSVLVINAAVPGVPGVSVGTNLNRGVIGNDAGGVVAIGAVTGVAGSSHALFGKGTQGASFGVAKAPGLLFTGNPALFGGVSSGGAVVLTASVSGTQSAVVNDTAVAQAAGALPAGVGGTAAVWGASFDATRITTGGTAFVVGRDGAGGNLIMGTYSGFVSNGSGGTWGPALKAGDTILNPDNTVLGTGLGGGTSATTSFDVSIMKAADVNGTPTYITRGIVTGVGANNSVVIANGKVVSGAGNTFRIGQAIAGYGGATFGSFSAVDITSNGNFAVTGNSAGIANSFVTVNGALVAKGGDTFGGLLLPTATGLTSAVEVNASGDYAFLYGNTTVGRTLAFGSSLGQLIVARETITNVGVDSDGNGLINGTGVLSTLTLTATNLYLSPRYTGVDGAPSVDIYFGGNGTGSGLTGNAIFKATVVVPEPTALAMLAPLGALAGRRRRA